jgi:3-methyladenine DNA glycosylase AlkC
VVAAPDAPAPYVAPSPAPRDLAVVERKPFKLWFDAALVDAMARDLAAVEADFMAERFVARATRQLDALEMMGRVGAIADALHEASPRPSRRALAALVATLPPPSDETDGITERGYRFWPYGEYIARHARDDRDAAFDAMVALTQRFSSEFAVRPFFADDVDDALTRLEGLLAHPSPHVRRWVSEGTRTRLPWGRAVPALREASGRRLALLSALRRDPSRYVQRSVANHLQDALKDDLDEAWPLLAAWAGEPHEPPRWIARHAARGLLKAGHGPTLALFGHAPGSDRLSAALTVHPTQVRAGESVQIVVAVHNVGDRPAVARIDYALRFPTQAGGVGRRVFRLADLPVEPRATATATKAHRFVGRAIRPLVPGEHRITALVDGRETGEVSIQVLG